MIETGVERVPVEEQVDSLEGGATVEQLRAAADDRDLDVGIFTDEELYWLSDADEVSDDDLDAPRLGELSRREAAAATQAALWLLTARGDLAIDGDQVRPTGRHALVAELRAAPLGVTRLEIEVRGEERRLAAVYRVGDDLVLLEEVSPIGLHHLVVTTASRAAAWLLATAAPEPIIGSTAPARTARREREIRRDVDRLARGASPSVAVVCARATGRGVEQRATTSYLVDGRFHVFGGWATTEDGDLALQELGAEDAAAWARWIVTEAIAPRFGDASPSP